MGAWQVKKGENETQGKKNGVACREPGRTNKRVGRWDDRSIVSSQNAFSSTSRSICGARLRPDAGGAPRASGPPAVVAARGFPNPEGPSGGVAIPFIPSTPPDLACGGSGQSHQRRLLEAELAARAVPDWRLSVRSALAAWRTAVLLPAGASVHPSDAASERECGTPVRRLAKANLRRTRS